MEVEMSKARWLGGALVLLGACDDGSKGDSAAADDSGEEIITDTEDGGCVEGFSVGQCPPDFTLVDGDGAAVSLSDFSGKAVLVAGAAEW